MPFNFVCFIVYAGFRYESPQSIIVVCSAIAYTAILVYLAMKILSLVIVSSIAVIFNMLMGLATLQKFVYCLFIVALCMQDV